VIQNVSERESLFLAPPDPGRSAAFIVPWTRYSCTVPFALVGVTLVTRIVATAC
jgi:hypothetical protein